MAFEIVYKKRFFNKLNSLLKYLQDKWNNKITDEFLFILYKRIETLKSQPNIGKETKLKNVRTILITKHNRLYYRISKNQLIILNLYDTRINPSKNPY